MQFDMVLYYDVAHCITICDITLYCDKVWHGDLIRSNVGHGMVGYCISGLGMVWSSMVCLKWFGMVWYGMVWYGMVWYRMAWYGDWNMRIFRFPHPIVLTILTEKRHSSFQLKQSPSFSSKFCLTDQDGMFQN